MRCKILIAIATIFILAILFIISPAILGLFVHDEPLQDDSDLRPITAEASGKKSAVEELKALKLACASLKDSNNFSEEFYDAEQLQNEVLGENVNNWECVRPRAEKHAALIQKALSQNESCLTELTLLSNTPNLRWPVDRGGFVPSELGDFDKEDSMKFVVLNASQLMRLEIVALARRGDWARAFEKTQGLIRLGTWMATSSETDMLPKIFGLAIHDEGVQFLRLLASHPHAYPNAVCQSADSLKADSQLKINTMIGAVKDRHYLFSHEFDALRDIFLTSSPRPERFFQIDMPRDQFYENKWVTFFFRHIPKSVWGYWVMPNTTQNQVAIFHRALLHAIQNPLRCTELESLHKQSHASRRTQLPWQRGALTQYVSPNALINLLGGRVGPYFFGQVKHTLCEPSLDDLNQAAMVVYAYHHRTGLWPATLNEAAQGCLTTPLAKTLAGNTIGYSPEEKMVYEQNAVGERVVDSEGHVVSLSLAGTPR